MKKQHFEILTEIKDGRMTAIGSTEDKDRIGDSLKMSDWDLSKFKKNPVLQAGHDYKPQFTIGLAKKIRVEGKKLIFEPRFHTITKLASDIKAMYEEGILKAWSVGYIPAMEEKGKNELLEISAVAVPANPNALTLIKSMENLDEQEEKNIKDKITEWIGEKGYHNDNKSNTEKLLKEEETIEKEVVEKPYKNEHSCHLHSPDKYDRIRSMIRTHNGKKYRVLIGFKNDKSEDQAYRYNKKIWTESEAKKHCKDHNGSFDAAAEEPSKKEEKYNCECLDCGHIFKTDEHCKNVSCPKCGGKTRRVERPGSGQKENKKDTKIIERWNKQLPEIFNTKSFDINKSPSVATTSEYSLYTNYLECEIKKLVLNNYLIPSPMIGSYLAAFKSILSEYKMVDERNFNSWMGCEEPIIYEVIKLNSKEKDDFMICGTGFYKDGDRKFMVKFQPSYYGLQAKIITDRKDKEWNKDLLVKIQKKAIDDNKLKGEAFCINGEFVDRGNVEWKDIVLKDTIKDSVLKSANQLNKKGREASGRGMMFIGKPGTGKTMSGKAMMANLKDKAFIWISTRDFEKMEYKKVLTIAFDLARVLSPCVLFMEDIDSWLMKEKSTLDLLKTELDGIQQNNGLVTILTSNSPEKFPDALLDRPGRFHDILEFELPDKDLRKSMIKEWTEIKEFNESEFKKLIDGTENFSGAHMRELIDFAKMIMEDDGIELKKALFISLDKIIKQRELVSRIREENKESKEDDEKREEKILTKEGRIISTKNKITIKSAIEALNKSVAALEKLLNLSEPSEDGKQIQTPAKAKGSDELKVVEPKKVDRALSIGVDEIALRTLQRIAKNTNFALNKLKKK